MAIAFLDTNIIIECLRGNKNILNVVKGFDVLYVNDIVIMELYQGARNKKELIFLKKHLSQFKLLHTNQEITTLAKIILEKYTLSHNTKIMDALIASTVIIYNIELYTLNKKDFKYLEQVKLL